MVKLVLRAPRSTLLVELARGLHVCMHPVSCTKPAPMGFNCCMLDGGQVSCFVQLIN